LQIKDRQIIKIEKVAFGGEGVGRIDNFVVFVPFAAPGDELEIEITQCKKKFARGKILKIIKASPLRVKPLCNYYETCGGCCYQHISYGQQLEIKKSQVEEAFVKIGKINSPQVSAVVPSSPCYHYRGKAQCHQQISSVGFKLGFLDVSGGKIVDIKRCEIMDETINEKIGRIREKAFGLSGKAARRTIWSDLPGERTVKEGQIRRIVKGKEFIVSSEGFFQNNLFLTEALVDEVSLMASAGELNTVVDVYCGCGLFSIFLAPFAGSIFGIELNPKAVECAQMNAAKKNIRNIKFLYGDAGEELLKGDFLTLSGKIDLLILDPPRFGCSESVLRTIAGLQPHRLIYISCNPATHARDVRLLSELGYKLLSLLPFDMFPQTQHIEVVALLEYKG
jgi:tRNA/tmRNA/rRNA uracil-C5-methylase (TrmA/RlmC/RlmD family)